LAEGRSAWAELLDELDRQLQRSHPHTGLGNTPSGIWSMDELRASFGDLGAMPEQLVPRVQRILIAYEDAFARIAAAKRVVGDHLEMLRAIKGSPTAGPVYLDRLG
jgi:hypothetical protein